MASDCRAASRMRFAVAITSRGGTMERMMSEAPRKRASVSCPVIEAEAMRFKVDLERPAVEVVTV